MQYLSKQIDMDYGKAEQERLVAEFAPLVKRIAYYMMARLPASVQVDDLIQVGLVGLLDAVRNFDQNQGAQFETYATQRIRGAMLDELRNADWASRSVRRQFREIEAALHTLEHRLGRAPGEAEIAAEMGIELAEYQQILQDTRGAQLLYLEDLTSADDSDYLERHEVDSGGNPLDILDEGDFKRLLVDAITALPEREKLVMGLYYEQELNLKEIGEVLGVSESRVCQLHSQAVARIRQRVTDWLPNKK